MRKNAKIVFAIVLVLSMMLSTVPTAFAANFADTENHWAEASIDRWSGYEVVKGKGNGEIFAPNAEMTRAEAAQVFANLLGLNKIDDLSGFTDVKEGAWYSEAIAKCYAAKILTGKGNGIMDPNGKITREEFFTMFGRAIQLRDAYAAGEAKEILSGAGFKDTDKVADWAAGQIEVLVSRGFVNGVSETSLAPKDAINRASVMSLLDKSISTYVGKTATEEEAKTVEAKSEGITLIANVNTTLVTGDADIVVVAAGAEHYDKETGDFEHNDIRVEGASMPVARVAGENITVTVAMSSETDDAAVTWTGVDSEIIFEVGTSAKSVSADAAGSKIIIKNGAKAESVTVSDTAKGATVEIEKGAEAESVSVAAEEANVNVGGTVKTVEVAETAKNTTVETESTAKVETVKTEAEGTAVTGTGKVETVQASEDVKVETKSTVENTNTEKAITVETKSGETVEVEKKDESASGEENKQEINGGSTPTGGGDGPSAPVHTHSYDKAVDPAWHLVTVNGTKVYEYGYLCAGCKDSVSPVDVTYPLKSDWTLEHPIYVAAGQTVTLDLNGKNLIAEGCDAIYNKGTLTLKSDGFVYPTLSYTSGNLIFDKTDTKGCVVVENGEAKNGIVNWGTLKVESCAVAVSDMYGSALVNQKNTATVENAVLLNTGLGNCVYNISGTTTLKTGTVAAAATYGFAGLTYGGEIVVEGGSYYSVVGFPFGIIGNKTAAGKLTLKERTMEKRAVATDIEADGGSGEVFWLAGTLSTAAAQQETDITVITALEAIVESGDYQTDDMEAYVDHFNDPLKAIPASVE